MTIFKRTKSIGNTFEKAKSKVLSGLTILGSDITNPHRAPHKELIPLSILVKATETIMKHENVKNTVPNKN